MPSLIWRTRHSFQHGLRGRTTISPIGIVVCLLIMALLLAMMECMRHQHQTRTSLFNTEYLNDDAKWGEAVEGESVRILPYYPPPVNMPKALIVSEGAVKSVSDGIILSANWDFPSGTSTVISEPNSSLLWTAPTDIDSSNSVVRFLTGVEPSLVMIQAFDKVGHHGIGVNVGGHILTDDPVAEYECSRFQFEPCMRISPDGLVDIHEIPNEIFELPHVLVFAIWSIEDADAPDRTAMANWAFYTKDVKEGE